jgi:membrane-anchored mycosin MYCP
MTAMRWSSLRRPLRAATAVVVLGALALPTAPALAAPSTPPGAPAKTAGLPEAKIAPLPVQPPPVEPGLKPKVEQPKVTPSSGYTPDKGCIQSGVTVPLETIPWPQTQLNINKAHQFATGFGQTVGVIDTGVSPHKYLGKRLVGGGDYVTNEKGLKDCTGHGTLVAGIIGANTHQQVGFDGMAPDSTIVSVRQTDSNYKTKAKNSAGQSQPAGTLGTLASAVSWLADMTDAPNGKVGTINISLTSCVAAGSMVDQDYKKLQAAIHHAVHDKNIVVVAAAGNKSQDASKGCTQNNDSADPQQLRSIPIPPWLGKDVLSVGSVNKQGEPSDFSVAGPWVGVAAPGENITSLDPGNPTTLTNQTTESDTGGGAEGAGGASPIQGTSFAAPYVSGLVALVRQRFPKLDADQVMHRIEATAQHPGGPNGRDNKVGFGMINPMAALTAMVPGEDGAQPQHATTVPAQLPPPYDGNNTAMTVALVGGGSALALLLLTIYVLHTLRRARERRGR